MVDTVNDNTNWPMSINKCRQIAFYTHNVVYILKESNINIRFFSVEETHIRNKYFLNLIKDYTYLKVEFSRKKKISTSKENIKDILIELFII